MSHKPPRTARPGLTCGIDIWCIGLWTCVTPKWTWGAAPEHVLGLAFLGVLPRDRLPLRRVRGRPDRHHGPSRAAAFVCNRCDVRGDVAEGVLTRDGPPHNILGKHALFHPVKKPQRGRRPKANQRRPEGNRGWSERSQRRWESTVHKSNERLVLSPQNPLWDTFSTERRGGGGGRPREALEGKGPQRRPQRRLGRRLEEVAKAVGGGYCRSQMPLRLALGVRGTVAGHRLGALEGGTGVPAPPSNASLGRPQTSQCMRAPSCRPFHCPASAPSPFERSTVHRRMKMCIKAERHSTST